MTRYRTMIANRLLRLACRVGGHDWSLDTLLGPRRKEPS